MSDPLRTMRPGEAIRAATMNEVIGAARAVRRNLGSGGAGQAQLGEQSQTAMRVKNNTGSALSRFAVVGIDGILIDATTNMSSFSDQPCLLGVATTEGGQYAVCLDAIPSGGIGMAAVDGIVQVKVNVTDEDTERHCAEVSDGVTTALTAVHRGSAEILWRESGTGEKWAIVRLGPRQPAVTFAVDLEQVGGTQGDDTTAASWTYDVTDAASGELLASAVDPTAPLHGWQRPSVGQMIAATKGTAHWDNDDELVLDWINEMVDAEACE